MPLVQGFIKVWIDIVFLIIKEKKEDIGLNQKGNYLKKMINRL